MGVDKASKVVDKVLNYDIGVYGDTFLYIISFDDIKKASLTEDEIKTLKVFSGSTIINYETFYQHEDHDTLYMICFTDINGYNKAYQKLNWTEANEVIKNAKPIIPNGVYLFKQNSLTNKEYTEKIIAKALEFSVNLNVNEQITNEYYSIGEFSELAGVTRQTLRNWELSGKLVPEYSVNEKRKYSRRQLLNLIKTDENTSLNNIIYLRHNKDYATNIGKIRTFLINNEIKNTLTIVDEENSTTPNNKAFKNLLKTLQFGNVDNVIIIGKDGILPINNLEMIRTIIETYANKLIII